ncbi:MAG TPA: zinc ribbon domain-containing protein [Casimicrobiaceae bacterium]|jgi:hypothetical protein
MPDAGVLNCPHCDVRAHSDDNFCTKCGASLAVAHVPGEQAGHGFAPQHHRSVRDTLLGSAAIVLAASALLRVIADLLVLIDALQNHAIAGVSIARGFALLGDAVTIPAFVFAAVGFLAPRGARMRRLWIAALFAGGAYAARFTADVISAVIEGTHHVSGTAVASDGVAAAGDVSILVAAMVAGVGLFHAAQIGGRVGPGRDGRLGWASVGLASAFLLFMVKDILSLIFYSDLHATGGLTTGLGFDAGGWGIAIAAGVIAAVAFLVSSQRQQDGQLDWWQRREVLLAVALSVFTAGALIGAIGDMIAAGALSGNGADGKTVASGWLAAVGAMGLMAGAACAATGFFLSRRSRAQMSR